MAYSLSRYHSDIIGIKPIQPETDDDMMIYGVVEQNERDFLLKILFFAFCLLLLLFVI